MTTPQADLSVTVSAQERTNPPGRDGSTTPPPESAEILFPAVPVPRSLPVRCWKAVTSAAEWAFGLFSLFVALAIVASIPFLQFLSLGYLLGSERARFSNGAAGVRFHRGPGSRPASVG